MEHGRPVQQNGASAARCIYFIGTQWLRTRASGIIYGVDKDAQAIAESITNELHSQHLRRSPPDSQP